MRYWQRLMVLAKLLMHVQSLGPPQLSFNTTSVGFSPASAQVRVTACMTAVITQRSPCIGTCMGAGACHGTMWHAQAFFDGDFYGAYPGAELSADPFLSLVNGSSGVGLPMSLTGLVATVSGSQVSPLCTASASFRTCSAKHIYWRSFLAWVTRTGQPPLYTESSVCDCRCRSGCCAPDLPMAAHMRSCAASGPLSSGQRRLSVSSPGARLQ
jgi:hypothetical protein